MLASSGGSTGAVELAVSDKKTLASARARFAVSASGCWSSTGATLSVQPSAPSTNRVSSASAMPLGPHPPLAHPVVAGPLAAGPLAVGPLAVGPLGPHPPVPQ